MLRRVFVIDDEFLRFLYVAIFDIILSLVSSRRSLDGRNDILWWFSRPDSSSVVEVSICGTNITMQTYAR